MKKVNRLFDNIIVWALVTYFIMGVGKVLGQLIIEFCKRIFGVSGGLNTVWMYGGMLGVVIAFLVVMMVFPRNRYMLSKLKISGKHDLKMMLIGAAGGAILNATCVFLAYLAGEFAFSYNGSYIGILILVFVSVMIQSGAEELAYRVFFYQKLKSRYKHEFVAIFGSAYLFSLVHILNPGFSLVAIFNIGLAGVMFGFCIYYFDSFWLATMIHTLWNFTQSIIFGLPNSGLRFDLSIFRPINERGTHTFFYDPSFGVEGAWASCVVLLFGIAAVIYFGNKKVKREDMKNITIFDTDLGTDDAIAYMLWSLVKKDAPDYVVASAGNTDQENACVNAAILKKLSGIDTCIVTGADSGNIVEIPSKDSFHGSDGFANIGEKTVKELGLTAEQIRDYIDVDKLKERLEAVNDITYICVGPLLTLNDLMKRPDLKDKIRRAYVMGGGLKQFNCPHETEYNFAKDPESVRTVLHSGIDITLFPLDLTNSQGVTEEEIDHLDRYGTYPELVALLRQNLLSNLKLNGIPLAVMHDSMPVLYKLFPEKFMLVEKTIDIDEYGHLYETPDGVTIKVAMAVEPGLLLSKIKEVFVLNKRN